MQYVMSNYLAFDQSTIHAFKKRGLADQRVWVLVLVGYKLELRVLTDE